VELTDRREAAACLDKARRYQRTLDQGEADTEARTRLLRQMTDSAAPDDDLARVRGWQERYERNAAPTRAAHREACDRLAQLIGPDAAATALALLDGWDQPLTALVDAAVSLARDA
jgi:hypothetical protein